jgi:hypothetical protein
MLLHEYSQLPVMQGDRKVDGMISWASIGKRQTFGKPANSVSDCMETHYEVKATDSIFDAIQVIRVRECVLVRSPDNRIVGILTATDVSESFEQVSRPFLFLSYIENHLRALIKPRFSVEELRAAKDPSDTERKVNSVSDMTFGEYIRLLEAPGKWEKIQLLQQPRTKVLLIRSAPVFRESASRIRGERTAAESNGDSPRRHTQGGNNGQPLKVRRQPKAVATARVSQARKRNH